MDSRLFPVRKEEIIESLFVFQQGNSLIILNIFTVLLPPPDGASRKTKNMILKKLSSMKYVKSIL
jgi:hypothetical protein